MTKTAILHGAGTWNSPHWIQGYRNQETRTVQACLDLCDREGITRLSVAYSGLYYEYREGDGWYITSDTNSCDQFHGLPPEGRKVL